MKKILILILLNFLAIGSLYCDELSKYSISLINEIMTGSEEGFIGWQPPVAGRHSGPRTLAISNNNKIYIPDRVNYRLNVYDFNMNFIKTIFEKGEKNAQFTNILKVDVNENIYFAKATFGLIKIDNKGNEIFKINTELLPRNILSHNEFFPVNKFLFFYNDKNEIQYIDNDGKIQNSDKALNLLHKLSLETQPDQSLQSKSMESVKTNNIVFDELRNNKEHLLINDQYFSTQFYKHKEYYKQIENIKPKVKAPIANSKSFSSLKQKDINIEGYSLGFIGYDNEHNSYWMAGKILKDDLIGHFVIILDKYGTVLDGFKSGESNDDKYITDIYPTSDALTAVAPNGDVYFMVTSKEKYSFYKVKRQW